jgi:hypothetical protein
MRSISSRGLSGLPVGLPSLENLGGLTFSVTLPNGQTAGAGLRPTLGFPLRRDHYSCSADFSRLFETFSFRRGMKLVGRAPTPARRRII